MKRAIILLLIPAVLLSCGKLKGTFAFKTGYDDVYRQKTPPLEFPAGQDITWAYVVPPMKSRHTIGIILQKQELMWVEVLTKTETIGEGKLAVHETYSDLEEGDYKIVIVQMGEKAEIIDEIEFFVYPVGDDNG